MTNMKTIPLLSIQGMIANLGIEWHSSDYFISPDEIIHKDNEHTIFRPDFYGLFICINGWMNLKINHQLIQIKPYSIMAISPNIILQREEQSDDCKGRAVFFTKDFLLKNIIDIHQLEAFHFFSGSTEVLVQLKKKEAEPLLQLYKLLLPQRVKTNLPYHHEIIRSLFFTFLYEAASVCEKNKMIPHSKYTRNEELNFKFKQLLAQHDKVQHNLKFYADSLFITPKYLIHAIKNACGKTPGELIAEALVADAKLLLKNMNHSVGSVAEELHFSDQAAFSKFFKKHTGLSPSSYRTKG
jgi:AraC-like DNA-binding protein